MVQHTRTTYGKGKKSPSQISPWIFSHSVPLRDQLTSPDFWKILFQWLRWAPMEKKITFQSLIKCKPMSLSMTEYLLCTKTVLKMNVHVNKIFNIMLYNAKSEVHANRIVNKVLFAHGDKELKEKVRFFSGIALCLKRRISHLCWCPKTFRTEGLE